MYDRVAGQGLHCHRDEDRPLGQYGQEVADAALFDLNQGRPDAAMQRVREGGGTMARESGVDRSQDADLLVAKSLGGSEIVKSCSDRWAGANDWVGDAIPRRGRQQGVDLLLRQGEVGINLAAV